MKKLYTFKNGPVFLAHPVYNRAGVSVAAAPPSGRACSKAELAAAVNPATVSAIRWFLIQLNNLN